MSLLITTILKWTHSARHECFMASVDLKDAYYSIPIAEEDRKFLTLTFEWKEKFVEYTLLANGLSSVLLQVKL